MVCDVLYIVYYVHYINLLYLRVLVMQSYSLMDEVCQNPACRAGIIHSKGAAGQSGAHPSEIPPVGFTRLPLEILKGGSRDTVYLRSGGTSAENLTQNPHLATSAHGQTSLSNRWIRCLSLV